jgi:hypothetical protein
VRAYDPYNKACSFAIPIPVCLLLGGCPHSNFPPSGSVLSTWPRYYSFLGGTVPPIRVDRASDHSTPRTGLSGSSLAFLDRTCNVQKRKWTPLATVYNRVHRRGRVFLYWSQQEGSQREGLQFKQYSRLCYLLKMYLYYTRSNRFSVRGISIRTNGNVASL